MKSGKKMGAVRQKLVESGRDVVMVENCGMENERVYRGIDEVPEDSGYFSLIIAKEKKER
jgi:precorrin-2/cobalt-factor-2 C20-methyltransferase